MKYNYKTKHTCSTEIDFEINENVISDVRFTSGCPGNLGALSVLVEGQKVDEVIEKLKGMPCGSRLSSCADQLATALGEVLEKGSGR